MSWLSDWLKSIVMVILLATFVDILLPNQTMQRYVKTVISLFILLTLLQPIFSLFQKTASVDQMLGSAQAFFENPAASRASLPAFQTSGASLSAGAQGEYQTQTQTQGASTAMQPLSSIQQQAEQLKLQQEERSRKLMQQQISKLMKQSIEQTPAFMVKHIKLETAKDGNGDMQIRTVRVQVEYRPPPVTSKVQSQTISSDVQSQAAKSLQVEPFKPVSISIEPRSDETRRDRDQVRTSGESVINSRTVESSSTNRFNYERIGQQTQASSGFEQQQSQIRMQLSKAWQVPEAHIDVEVTGEKP